MNNNINLLDFKSKINTTRSDTKQRNLRIIAISLLFIVSVFSAIILILVALSPLPQLKKQQKIASFNLSLAQADIIKLALVKDRVSSIKLILDKRRYYDRTLETLQSKLPSGVVIENISIKQNNMSFTLSSNSLLLLDNFLNTITNPDESGKEYSNIVLNKLGNKESENNFSLDISMKTL